MRQLFFSLFSTLFFWVPVQSAENDEEIDAKELLCADEVLNGEKYVQPFDYESESFFFSLLDSKQKLDQWIEDVRTEYSVEHYIYEDFRYICEGLFPKLFLQLCGFYEDHPETSVYPGMELHDKLRVTFINGISNLRHDYLSTLKTISESHGGINIHYVFRPTQGWNWDMYHSLVIKLGFVSQHAVDLAETWKRLIHEMGGTDSGGKIIHYAHSIGGTDTMAARGLLTPEEVRMIRVITIGSPSLIPDIGFEQVRNYVNLRDAISYFDPVNYIDAMINNPSHVTFIGDWNGVPFIEHAISENVYTNLLMSLGAAFLLEFQLCE